MEHDAGRFLLNPQPLAARTAHEWGVVAEVVPNGKALGRRCGNWPIRT